MRSRERKSGPTPSLELLQLLFKRSGMQLPRKQLEQFWVFHQLLRKRNAELDLTRLHSFDSMVLKLYVDSAIVATLVDLPSPLLDLGSGAGFPGIPLKIVRPELHLVLSEPRAKRVRFLEEAIATLGLRNIEVLPHRIGTRFDRRMRGVITRAVETIPATLKRLSPWVETETRILFMKGPGCQTEVESAQRDFGHLFQVVEDKSYAIPQTPLQRRLVVFEKTEESEPTLADLEAMHTIASRTGSTMRGREVRQVESAGSGTFRLLRSLRTSRGLRKANLALVGGSRHVLETLRDFPGHCAAWISAEAPPEDAPETLAWYCLSKRLCNELDPFGTGPPFLLIRIPEIQSWSDDDWPLGCTLFVPFQDPENVGALIRSAAAFNVSRIVLQQETAHPFHPRSVRAAGGSTLFRVPLLAGPSIHRLKLEGAPLLTLSQDGQDIGDFVFPERFGLLPGLEGSGLPPGLRTTQALSIPMAQGVDSLNAATATSIALYLWHQQRARGQRA